ncbi:MAG: WD40 repeat domain-containing protein [Pirellulaceae bacterium]
MSRNAFQSLLLLSLITCLPLTGVGADEPKEGESAPQPPTIGTLQRWVTSLAFLPDGRLATVGGESLQFRPGDVNLWNVKSGKLLEALNKEEAHGTNIWSVSATPDGQTLVTTGYDGKVVVWDVAKRQPRATLDKHTGWVRASAVSADGKLLATGGEDGTVVVWNLGDEVKEAKTLKAHDTSVYSLAFSPNGKTLATASTDKTVKLFDWNSDAEPKTLEGHDDAVWCVRFSPKGERLATCGADRKIKLWSADGQEQATLEGHKDWISAVAFSPDGKMLASASHDRTVRLWDIEKKAETAVLEQPRISVWCVAYSPDGAHLAAGTHKHLLLWTTADNMLVFEPAVAEKGGAVKE